MTSNAQIESNSCAIREPKRKEFCGTTLFITRILSEEICSLYDIRMVSSHAIKSDTNLAGFKQRDVRSTDETV